MLGGSSQGTLWTFPVSWFRDHHKALGWPQAKWTQPGTNVKEILRLLHSHNNSWVGGSRDEYSRKVSDYLRHDHDALGRKETAWATLWKFDSPSAPFYHCNPIDSQFRKEKKLRGGTWSSQPFCLFSEFPFWRKVFSQGRRLKALEFAWRPS